MPTPRSSLWRLADEKVGGRLAAQLTALRARGRSWDEIAIELAIAHDLRVSAETLRTWAKALGIDGGKAA